MKMISYAQNGEDVMLSRALRDVPHGFYVDVGAAGPTEHSVTRTFYDRGWTGINVEPTERHFAELAAARPHDVNLRAALDERAGEATFFAFEGTGLSTLDPGVAEAHRPGGWPMTRLVAETRTLADVCAAYAPPTIHFLKIDVEGAEARVLRGADFARFRPWIVVVEATRPMSPEPDHAEWEPILTGAGYEFAWFDGLNRFYLAAEKAGDLRRHFQVPVNYFDDFDIHNPAAERAAAAEAEAAGLRTRLGDAEAEAGRFRATAAGATATAETANALAAAANAAAVATRDRLQELQAHVAVLRGRLDDAAAREDAAETRLALQRRDYEDQLAARHADLHGRRLAQERAEDAVVHLQLRVRELEERLAAATPATAATAGPPPGTDAAPRVSARTVALAVYRALFRPVVRPAMWRTRSFLVAGLQHDQHRLQDEQRHTLAVLQGRADRLDAAVHRLDAAVAPLHALVHQSRDETAVAAGAAGDTAAEMAALARSVETALLAVAVTAQSGRLHAE